MNRKTVASALLAASIRAACLSTLALYLNPGLTLGQEAGALALGLFLPWAAAGPLALALVAAASATVRSWPRPFRPVVPGRPFFASLTFVALSAVAALYWHNHLGYRHSLPLGTLDALAFSNSIKDDPIRPQVVLSGISLFNRPGEKLSYEGFISELKEITLPYDQNDLRFDFVGLHFSAPLKNKYKYFLENFDNDWVDAGNQRYATYTNLDPGEYVFRATASNKDGVWNKTGISITIIITPPWWQTTWAYIFYALILGNVLYFTWKLQVKRIKVKHEFEMSRFEAQKIADPVDSSDEDPIPPRRFHTLYSSTDAYLTPCSVLPHHTCGGG